MKYFLDDLNQIRAIEEGQEFLIEESWKEPSEEELNKLLNPPKTEEQILAEQIQNAKDFLSNTDFKMTVDYYATLLDEEKEELTFKRAEAREFLREQGL